MGDNTSTRCHPQGLRSRRTHSTALRGRSGSTAITGSPVSFTTRAPVPGVLVDDFDSYPANDALAAAYQRNTGGDPITPTLAPPGEGGTACC